MLRKRIIVCLDVQNGRIVKGARFQDMRDAGDPVELAQRYEREGADEIVFFDISASPEGRHVLYDIVQRTADSLFIPLTVGGGIADLSDIGLALRAGADKVSINTAAVTRPELITEAAQRFGSQCIVSSVDARLERRQIELMAHSDSPAPSNGTPTPATWYRVFTHNGRNATELDAVEWSRSCADLGAGEVLITGIDQDGRRTGYDLELTARVAEAVSVPVIASGGAGTSEHLRDAFLLAGADATLLAGILHDGSTTIGALKTFLANAGIPIRTGPVELPWP